MQSEIENVIRAYKTEVGKEEKLLITFLSALAVGSAARKRMTHDMAQAVVNSNHQAHSSSKLAQQNPPTSNAAHGSV